MKDATKLVEAVKRLRKAQVMYMLDRGNDELGKAVGTAAREVDLEVLAYETPGANAEAQLEKFIEDLYTAGWTAPCDAQHAKIKDVFAKYVKETPLEIAVKEVVADAVKKEINHSIAVSVIKQVVSKARGFRIRADEYQKEFGRDDHASILDRAANAASQTAEPAVEWLESQPKVAEVLGLQVIADPIMQDDQIKFRSHDGRSVTTLYLGTEGAKAMAADMENEEVDLSAATPREATLEKP